MLRLTNLANKYQRRTLRALYAQTQATPYDATLDSAFVRTGGAIEGTATTGITGSKSAILPGLVAIKLAGEVVTVAGDALTNDQRPFGLFANFVGGEITDIAPDFDQVGVWRGAGGVFEVLAPAFDDTGLSAFAAAEDGTAAKEVYMQSSATGQMKGDDIIFDVALATDGPPVARLMSYLSANAIIVELLV